MKNNQELSIAVPGRAGHPAAQLPVCDNPLQNESERMLQRYLLGFYPSGYSKDTYENHRDKKQLCKPVKCLYYRGPSASF